MAEELARLRFAEMESRMNQMAELIDEMRNSQTNQLASMMTDMKELILANRAEPNNPAEINPANPVLAEEIKEEPAEEVRLGRDEVPLGVLPGIVTAEGSKVKGEEVKAKETARLSKIEECLARQGYEIDRFDSISPYAKVQVPDNYKEPEFPNRYDGTGCPKSHLKYYLRKMARYSDNAPLLISTFQDSLQGAALVWYVALDVEDYQAWDELASAFLRQYRFNVEALPTREDLVQTKKKTSESFKTYSQRWKAVASQVKPVVQESELMELFLRSLPYEYYEKMYVSGSPSFNQLLIVGERVEREFKDRRTQQEAERRAHPLRRGKEAMNEVAFVAPTHPTSVQDARPPPLMGQAQKSFEARRKFTPRQYTPLPRPLAKLLPMLLEARLVAKEVPRESPPRFTGFDVSKCCEYHMGEKGHDVNNCLVLKNKVQNLIDRGMLDFKEPEPNVHQNPLPNHQGVNSVHDGNQFEEQGFEEPEYEEEVYEEEEEADEEYQVQMDQQWEDNRVFLERARVNGNVVAPLGEDGGRHQFMVGYDPPPWALNPDYEVVADGWGDEEDFPEEDADKEYFGEMTMPDYMPEFVWDDEGDAYMGAPAEAEETDRLMEFIHEGEEDHTHGIFSNTLSPDTIMDHGGDDDEGFNRMVSARIDTPQEMFDCEWGEEEDLEEGASWELTTFDTELEDDWGVIVEERGIEDPRYVMADFVLDEMFVTDFAEGIREFVIRLQADEEVSMIMPYVIHLTEEVEQEVPSSESPPPVVTFANDMSKMCIGESSQVRPIVIELPSREVLDTKAVPWEYPSLDIGAITRSGRCYVAKEGEKEKKAVTEEEAKHVLEIVRTSEFEVVEQLRKMPAQISLLELFKTSEKHKNALLKVLNEVHVPETINEQQLEDFVGAILLKDQITFSDEDFPEEGRAHNKALYIAVRSSGKEISHVLIDNGSAFNLCPLNTLRRLGKENAMKTSKATVRAFDGMSKEVLGDVELEVLIGPTLFNIEFQVLDVSSAFNFLLGRPWIHTAAAIPSSAHQLVRFSVEGKTITVYGETDCRTTVGNIIPRMEPEAVQEASYHSLELIHAIHTPVGSITRIPALSPAAIMTGKIMIEHGYIPGTGLGKYAQGILEPIAAIPMPRGGLGYHGETGKNEYASRRGRTHRGRRGGRAINPSTWKGKAKESPFWDIPLSHTFPGPSRMLLEDQVYSEEEEEDLAALYELETVNVLISENGDIPAIE